MKKRLLLDVITCLSLLLTGCASTRSPVPTIAPTQPAPTVSPNLVENGSFDSSLEKWMIIGRGNNPYHPDDPGRADFKISDGALEVNIKNQGFQPYSVMLYQFVYFEKGVTYRISFDARSDSAFQVVSNIVLDYSYANLSGDQAFKLTNVMSHYSYQFTKEDKSQNALFQFFLGAAGTGKVIIDNIVIEAL